MTTLKACRNCYRLVEGSGKCPECGGDLTSDWMGYVIIIDPKNSEIAKKMNITKKGKFALRVR